jgi:hypothetical protein
VIALGPNTPYDNWFQQPNVWRGLLDNSAVLQPLEAETAGDVKPDIKPLVGSSSLFPRDRIVYHVAPGRYVSLALVKAPTFAVFGTLVDWRSSLIREGEALGRARGLGC